MLKKYKQILIHVSLFVITLITTTLSGAEWTAKYGSEGWDYVLNGLWYSIPFIGILTVHEFGHYFLARYNKVKATLPYYIPFYFPGVPSIGTFGAFIRMKTVAFSRRAIFDIGVAGPLAGFAVALIVLTVGFITLPEKEYIYSIHPDYQTFDGNYENHVYTYDYLKKQSDQIIDSLYEKDSLNYVLNSKTDTSLEKPIKVYQTEFTELAVGKNLLFLIFEHLFSYQGDKIPNAFELFHYPLLFAAYLALFFTALNLIPIGQLDGGHVIYGLFGYEGHRKIASVFFIAFVFVAGLGMFKVNVTGINFFTANGLDQLEFALLYIGFLYILFARMFNQFMNALLMAVAIFTCQFLVEYLFPSITGFNGWLLYAFLIGRFLGVYHPPAMNERPLDLKRKLIGWFSMLIFVLCFTPEVLTFVTIKK